MSVVDTLRTASEKLTDSDGDLVPIDFYYGDISTWITVDLINQDKDFIFLNPISGIVPDKVSGFLREDYSVSFVFGRVANKDLSKNEAEEIIWALRPYALQYLRRIFDETNTTGAKLFMPREDGDLRESREFSANNVYGIMVNVTIKERFPSETC